MENKIYHIGLSGGKDSTALAIWMRYESGIPTEQIKASFCNTGNETTDTLNHIRMLSDRVIPIEWLEPELDFYELVYKKHRFPSAKARFCTQELKTDVTRQHIKHFIEKGFEVVCVTGVRADESPARSKLSEREFDWTIACEVWRPLLHWTIKDVWAIHDKYNISRNPMYAKGAIRVGCAPCIFSRKSELRMFANVYPERIDRIRKVEQEAGGHRGFSSFFSPIKTPKKFHDKVANRKRDGTPVTFASIDAVITWARNGDNYDFEDELFSDAYVCDIGLGQCE